MMKNDISGVDFFREMADICNCIVGAYDAGIDAERMGKYEEAKAYEKDLESATGRFFMLILAMDALK